MAFTFPNTIEVDGKKRRIKEWHIKTKLVRERDGHALIEPILVLDQMWAELEWD